MCDHIQKLRRTSGDGGVITDRYADTFSCGSLQMESSKAYPRRIVKKKYNHKYRKTALQLKSCFLVLKRGINIFFTEKSFKRLCVLKCFESFFTGTDLNNIFDIIYEYLAVTILAGMKNFFSSVNNCFDWYQTDNDLNLNLW